MAVSFETSLPAGYTPPTSASKTTVDYQSFLKLLIAQMKNQDPTNPTSNTEFVAQLATFSQVEQSVQMNTKLDQMLTGSSLSQASSLVGRTVTSADGKTSGIVKEVTVAAAGLTATTTDGKTIAMTSGVKVS
jgi:flagellar basal-body rod modification protein FlgD